MVQTLDVANHFLEFRCAVDDHVTQLCFELFDAQQHVLQQYGCLLAIIDLCATTKAIIFFICKLVPAFLYKKIYCRHT